MPNNIIMADKATGEWTTEQIASKQAPSGNITLEGTGYPAYAIYKMPAVTQVTFVNATSISDHGVAECSNVQRVIAQKAKTLSQIAFGYNSNLRVIDILGGGVIGTNLAFAQDPRLEVLIIRSAAAKDACGNCFNGSASAQKPVHVYVPQATISSYAALTNWGNYISAGRVIFEELEGSLYEPLDWWEE